MQVDRRAIVKVEMTYNTLGRVQLTLMSYNNTKMIVRLFGSAPFETWLLFLGFRTVR